MLTLTLPRVASLVSLSLLAAACSDTTSTEAMDASAATEQTLIIDTHIDIPFSLHRGYVDVSKATDGGDFDYPPRQGWRPERGLYVDLHSCCGR